jgi:hypothetical protein
VLTWLRGYHVAPRPIAEAFAWAPFPLIIVLGLAARAALALPIEPKANWVFRMTEADAIRADQLGAAERVVMFFATVVPIVLTLPLQWVIAGPRAAIAAAVTGAFGLLWVEVLLRDWRRIPFTCSYLPGKQTVAQSFVAALFIFFVVGTFGAIMEDATLRKGAVVPQLVLVAILLAIVAACRRLRRTMWRELPLMFDDELPSDVQVFKLSD